MLAIQLTDTDVEVYTVIIYDPSQFLDEASRERFIYPYRENSSHSTIDFVKRSIAYLGYEPDVIQTTAERSRIRKKRHAFLRLTVYVRSYT